VPFGLHRSKHLSDNFGKDTPLVLCIFVDLGFLLSENSMSLASACLTIAQQHTISSGHTDELIHKRAKGFVNLLLGSLRGKYLPWFSDERSGKVYLFSPLKNMYWVSSVIEFSVQPAMLFDTAAPD
jgi:hypothetical protein